MAWMSAKTWKTRPSEIYHIAEKHGDYAAYCFDKAVMVFGNAYDSDMHEAAMNAKTPADAKRAVKVVQQRWLTDEEEEPPSDSAPDPEVDMPPEKPAFRDPAKLF